MQPDRFETWLSVDIKGLFCRPGGFYVDPSGPVSHAVITHGHSDHARAGHGHVLATTETLAFMLRLLQSIGIDGLSGIWFL
jgi:putative mRNA 3-end processing factor